MGRVGNYLGNIRKGWERFLDLPYETLNSIKGGLMFAMLADLFLVIYFLKQRTIGIFLFLMIIIFLCITLLAMKEKEKDLPPLPKPKKPGDEEGPNIQKNERRKTKMEEQTELERQDGGLFDDAISEMENSVKNLKSEMSNAVNYSWL